jgi:hypothetical protein
MNDTKLWDSFFTLYNEGLACAYETALESYTEESRINDPHFFAQMKNHVLNSMQSWYGKAFDDLSGNTPEAMIDSLNSCKDTAEMVELACGRCIDDIPEYLKMKLGSFGGEAIYWLRESALSASWEGDYTNEDEPTDSITLSAFALKLLGEWEIADSIPEVLEKFCATETPDEFIADAFKSYIVSLDELAIAPVVEKLNTICESGDPFKTSHEYLLISLTLASMNHKSDSVFNCLRASFRKMEHKVIGAICIGDYKDPRGVTVLKGYLDRNEGNFDRQLFYEILSSIKRLGGDTSDIKDPFRDFK